MVRRFWSQISVSNKPYVIIGVMTFLIAIELLTLWFVMDTMSGVRALVNGESQWSKAQKESVISLHEYARTQNEHYRRKFFQDLDVIYGDRQARLAILETTSPDLDRARDGLLRGKNHPSDIDDLINLLYRFQEISFLKEAIVIWKKADARVDHLVTYADELHRQLADGKTGRDIEVIELLRQVDLVNAELTIFEEQFSSYLGEGSRRVQQSLVISLVLLVVLVEMTGVGMTASLSRTIFNRVREFRQAAVQFGRGDLDTKIPIRDRDEFGALALSLNRMANDLKSSERANRLKSLFLKNVSHELRTPLGAILGFAKLLRDPNLSSVEKEQYVSIIEKNGESLTKIINDILDLSKVEAGYLELELSNFSLQDLLSDVMQMSKAKLHSKMVDIQLEIIGSLPEVMTTDAQRLQQILMDIIGNAIKFTERGVIKVECEARGKTLYLNVIDTGVGIAEGQQKLLFKSFSQVDASLSRRYEGAGLGLALSRRLARMLGGDVILAHSELGVGSTFSIHIPFEVPVLAKADLTEGAEDATSYHLVKGKSILVVDDSEINRLLVEKILTKHGAVVTTATNGEEALHLALKKNYDAILMDIQMPVMDGRLATKALRERGYRLPIIALTAHALKEDRDRCLEAGCDDYLTKPVQFDVLFSALTRYMYPAAASGPAPRAEPPQSAPPVDISL